MVFEKQLTGSILQAVRAEFGVDPDPARIVLQHTNPDFEGDVTFVVFGIVKQLKAAPEEAGRKIGEFLVANGDLVEGYSVVKGFLNLLIARQHWMAAMQKALMDPAFGTRKPEPDAHPVVIEYSSPNTNKPLHLGHIRNNLLGWSVAEILKANGQDVRKVNLVNDRGIHICKSMLAWQKTGNGETPESSGIKGDHLAGKYYVAFDRMLKEELAGLVKKGMSGEEAMKKSTLMEEAREMLRRWEAGDPGVRELWKRMNGWVYEGFDSTYKALGVDFDKIYYESDTYVEGKKIVQEGLAEKVFYRRPDGSVWIDLTADKLDEKVILRADGTSVYITQDIGTARLRYDDFSFSRMIYVVGNEQDYHFRVLKIIISRLGMGFSEWSDAIEHLSYGMVDLPSGKMKSREGTVVDADDLIEGMRSETEARTRELGKIGDFESVEAHELYRVLAMGALKYYILKVDPEKRMLYNPEESIDIHGNTGPFIQYAYARIRSVLRKADATEQVAGYASMEVSSYEGMNEKEKTLVCHLAGYPDAVREAGEKLSPAVVAHYVYEAARLYNQFYHDHTIVDPARENTSMFRLQLSVWAARVMASATHLLGMEMPERM